MKDFAELIKKIDSTNKTNAKVSYFVDYLDKASDDDKLWAIALLSHRRPKRPANTTLLRKWASEVVEIPLWLFEESYHIAGDLAETIALLVPQSEKSVPTPSLSDLINEIIDIRGKDEQEIRYWITNLWMKLSKDEKFVFNKILTGGFRIGVSQKLMTKALAIHLNKDPNEVAHRLMGEWDPNRASFQGMFVDDKPEDRISRPYPFYLAYAIEEKIDDLGNPDQWTAERKWDGIRGQLIKRKGKFFVWSRGEELITHKFPEYEDLADLLEEGTVLDGEIICHDGKLPMPFNFLQTRIGRKNVSKKLLNEAPVKFIAYDILEYKSKDIRNEIFKERRKKLESLAWNIKSKTDKLILSPVVDFKDWNELQEERDRSREFLCEGIMLKKNSSVYGVGRKKGDWWKWKVDPMTIDGVLTYAMQGHGRRANLFTDYTFALWDSGELVTFAKAYSGLTDKEIVGVDKFVRNNTIEKFGPVRQLKPELVFEIAFEGIAESKRHKSGVALRFPRINRWRKDKLASQANSLDDILNFIK